MARHDGACRRRGSRRPCRARRQAATTPSSAREVGRVLELARDARASATGRPGRRTGRRRRRARRSHRRRAARRRRLDLDDPDDPLVQPPDVGVGDVAQTGAADADARRRGPRPADSAGTSPPRAPARPSPSRGTMIPRAPMSSARPIRSRSPDCGRTSGVGPADLDRLELPEQVRLGRRAVLEVDEQPVVAGRARRARPRPASRGRGTGRTGSRRRGSLVAEGAVEGGVHAPMMRGPIRARPRRCRARRRVRPRPTVLTCATCRGRDPPCGRSSPSPSR